MAVFQLLFGDDCEFFRARSPLGEVKLPPLGLLYEVTRRFYALGETLVYEALGQVGSRFQLNPWDEEPIVPVIYYADEDVPELPELDKDEAGYLWLEYLALVELAGNWLSPEVKDGRGRLILPLDRFTRGLDRRNEGTLAREFYAAQGIDAKAIRTFGAVAFKERMSELVAAGDAREGKYLSGYRSHSLFPLLWAELLHAALTNTYARTCGYCHGVFALKPPYRRLYCDMKCRKNQRIETWPGGIDGWREYMRRKQHESRDRRKKKGVRDGADSTYGLPAMPRKRQW